MSKHLNPILIGGIVGIAFALWKRDLLAVVVTAALAVYLVAFLVGLGLRAGLKTPPSPEPDEPLTGPHAGNVGRTIPPKPSDHL